MPRFLIIVLLLCALTAAAQAQSAADCFRQTDAPLDRSNDQKLKQQLATWVDTCRKASEANPADTRLKLALSKVLWHAEGRPASLMPLREAIAQGDTEACWNYSMTSIPSIAPSTAPT
jgi:hypothetical protein